MRNRYFFDDNTEELLTYNEMKELWERYKDDENFCTYDTDNFDDYLEELLKDVWAGVRELDEEECDDILYELAEQDAEKELCNIHCPFDHNIECSQCDAFYAVRDYYYEIIKDVKENS